MKMNDSSSHVRMNEYGLHTYSVIFVSPILITVGHSSFRYVAIGDQSLTNSSRIPLKIYDYLSSDKMDNHLSPHINMLKNMSTNWLSIQMNGTKTL